MALTSPGARWFAPSWAVSPFPGAPATGSVVAGAKGAPPSLVSTPFEATSLRDSRCRYALAPSSSAPQGFFEADARRPIRARSRSWNNTVERLSATEWWMRERQLPQAECHRLSTRACTWCGAWRAQMRALESLFRWIPHVGGPPSSRATERVGPATPGRGGRACSLARSMQPKKTRLHRARDRPTRQERSLLRDRVPRLALGPRRRELGLGTPCWRSWPAKMDVARRRREESRVEAVGEGAAGRICGRAVHPLARGMGGVAQAGRSLPAMTPRRARSAISPSA